MSRHPTRRPRTAGDALPGTLAVYLARRFAASVAGVTGSVAAVILLFDLLELLRRAADRPEMTFTVVAGLAALRLPGLLATVLPLCLLFAAIAAFRRSMRSGELVVARAAGLSVRQFLTPALAVTLLVGIGAVTVLTPVGTALRTSADSLERAHREPERRDLAIDETGLWIAERTPAGQTLLRAGRTVAGAAALTAVTVFRFEPDGRFSERIDGARADLTDAGWRISPATVTRRDGGRSDYASMLLPAELDWHDIERAGLPPEVIAIWNLPSAIALRERHGFSGRDHRLHLQSQLASPFLLCGLVLIAAAFVLHPGRRLGTLHLLATGAATGLGLFVLSALVRALGAGGQLPVALAAWAPAVFCLAAGAAAVLRIETGRGRSRNARPSGGPPH